MIIYIHGFASTGDGEKPKILKEMFGEKHEVVSPTLPVDPKEAAKLLNDLVRANAKKNECLIAVGTSLGGFYALHLAAIFDMPAVLINPSIDPAVSLERKLGVNVNYSTKEEFTLTTQHLKTLSEMKTQIDEAEKTFVDIKVLLGTSDSTLDINRTKEYLKYADTFEYDTGHRFDKLKEVLEENEIIQRILSQ